MSTVILTPFMGFANILEVLTTSVSFVLQEEMVNISEMSGIQPASTCKIKLQQNTQILVLRDVLIQHLLIH